MRSCHKLRVFVYFSSATHGRWYADPNFWPLPMFIFWGDLEFSYVSPTSVEKAITLAAWTVGEMQRKKVSHTGTSTFTVFVTRHSPFLGHEKLVFFYQHKLLCLEFHNQTLVKMFLSEGCKKFETEACSRLHGENWDTRWGHEVYLGCRHWLCQTFHDGEPGTLQGPSHFVLA